MAVSFSRQPVANCRPAAPVDVRVYQFLQLGRRGRHVEVDDGRVTARSDSVVGRADGVDQLKGKEEHEDGRGGVHGQSEPYRVAGVDYVTAHLVEKNSDYVVG